jgi:hypothetical protein
MQYHVGTTKVVTSGHSSIESPVESPATREIVNFKVHPYFIKTLKVRLGVADDVNRL